MKVHGKWEKVEVKKHIVEWYNAYMNGVDKSDQILSKYNLSHKCVRWLKTLFYDIIDIAVVNGFILFQQHCKNNPDLVTLKRDIRYSFLDFREELIRNIMGFEEYAEPPTFRVHKPVGNFTSKHIPQFSDSKRNSKVCYCKDKKELKVYITVLHRSLMFSYIVQWTKIVLLSGTMQNIIEK